jgi:hypothetical protein
LVTITLNTTSLIGHPASPFYVEFQLEDGSGTNDANNTVSIRNFNFGGGSQSGLPVTTGGASGSFSSGVRLTDSGFFNQFYQQFQPGTKLSFDVNLSKTADLGPQPDQFTFAILDCALGEIPTKSPANAFVSVDLRSPLRFNTYSGNPAGILACGGGPTPLIPAPTITPEPSEWAVFGGAAALLLCEIFRRTRLVAGQPLAE